MAEPPGGQQRFLGSDFVLPIAPALPETCLPFPPLACCRKLGSEAHLKVHSRAQF